VYAVVGVSLLRQSIHIIMLFCRVSVCVCKCRQASHCRGRCSMSLLNFIPYAAVTPLRFGFLLCLLCVQVPARQLLQRLLQQQR
jgi:hypothetical protein